MRTRYALIILLFIAPILVSAQSYCSPSFVNGCAVWNTHAIDVGSISWLAGSDCTVSDHTAISTMTTPGAQLPMTVTNGAWCGVSVWVDFDQDLQFQDSENLYHIYTGGTPSYTYSFNLDIPMGTPNGSYRMRVISPWGSDGFSSTNMNGFGPCGMFQYGNFQDFTLVVDASTGIENEEHPFELTLAPNPTTGLITVRSQDKNIGTLTIHDLQGRTVLQVPSTVKTDLVSVDLSSLAIGTYVIRDPNSGSTYKVVRN